MIITNTQNLPKPFVDAVTRNYEYKDKRYSVTSILKGYKEILLTRRHYSEMEQDVADSIWMILGTAVHKVLEESNDDEDLLKEIRLEWTVPNGYTLSGVADLYSVSEQKVIDYKTGSVWKVMFGDWEDYRKQLLYYAVLLRKNGYPCNKASNVMLLKDHSMRDAKLKADYPEFPVYTKNYDFTEEELQEAEQEIIEKFLAIEKMENLPDEAIPACSKAERWASEDKYAVMKKGRQKALKLCQTEDEAEEYMSSNGGDYIEFRPGEDKKCMDYCSCCQYCSYWKAKNEEN